MKPLDPVWLVLELGAAAFAVVLLYQVSTGKEAFIPFESWSEKIALWWHAVAK